MAAINILPATVITTAVTGSVSGTIELPVPQQVGLLCMLSKFTYGSGGTTAKFWLQTSFDNGTTWADVMNHAYTTASLTKIGVNTFGNVTPANVTDATLADNTQNTGLLGDRFRIKYTTTGTYAGNTTIDIWLLFKR